MTNSFVNRPLENASSTRAYLATDKAWQQSRDHPQQPGPRPQSNVEQLQTSPVDSLIYKQGKLILDSFSNLECFVQMLQVWAAFQIL